MTEFQHFLLHLIAYLTIAIFIVNILLIYFDWMTEELNILTDYFNYRRKHKSQNK